MTEVKIKQVVQYGGHSISANGSVNLTFKSDYSELVGTVKLTQLLNEDITVKAKLPNRKPFTLGSFRISRITIDDDGESRIKLSGLDGYIETDNLNALPTTAEDDKRFAVLFEARVDSEGDENEDGDED